MTTTKLPPRSPAHKKRSRSVQLKQRLERADSSTEACSSSAGRVPLSPGYQYKLVAGVLSGDSRCAQALEIIAPEHYSVPGLPAIWETIRACLRTYGRVPTPSLLREQLYRQHPEPAERAFFASLLKKCRRTVRDVEINYIVKHARDFAAMQQLIIAYRDAVPFIQRGDLGGVRELLGKAVLSPSEADDTERWRPVPLSELKAPREEDDWIWRGYLRPGSSTLLISLWKAGKTTLVSYLLRELSPDGGGPRLFMGRAVQPATALVISEESRRDWRERRDALGLGDHVRVIPRPFLGRPTLQTWLAFVARVANDVRKDKTKLVVFDSLANLWPVAKENDTGEVLAAVQPVCTMLGEAGAAVWFLHHPRKGDAAEGQASRGAGALPAIVDIIVEVRRYDAGRRHDTRRVLSAYSRYDATPPELVVQLEKGVGYTVVGTKRDASAADRLEVMLPLLTGTTGRTPEDVRKHWPKDGATPTPSLRTLQRDLEAAWEGGKLDRTGAGTRGKPFRYSIRDIPLHRGRGCHESNISDSPEEDAIRDSGPSMGNGPVTNPPQRPSAFVPSTNGADPIAQKIAKTLEAITERRRRNAERSARR